MFQKKQTKSHSIKSWSSIKIVPFSTLYNLNNELTNVVFPHPIFQTIPIISPALISNEISLSDCNSLDASGYEKFK